MLLVERAQGWAAKFVNAASAGTENLHAVVTNLVKRRRLASRGVDADDHKQASDYLEKGRRYYNEKRYERAEHYFLKAIGYDAGYPLAHYYLGLSYYKLENTELALKSWKRVIQIAPDSEAAAKADRKIGTIRGKMTRVIEKLGG